MFDKKKLVNLQPLTLGKHQWLFLRHKCKPLISNPIVTVTIMEFTVGQIAALVNGQVEGNPEAKISTFAKIEEGHPGAISFLANEKYTHYIYSTESSAVLVRQDFVPESKISTTLIRVADPYATIAALLRMVSEILNKPKKGIEQPCYIADGVEIPEDAYVGAFAYIASGAKIGSGAQIYPQTFVGEGATVGSQTILYSGVKIYKGCKIGDRCIIHSGAVIGADGFGFAPVDGHYEKIPQLGIVEISDDVEIGANTTVDRATMGATKIHKGVKLDNLIQIAHNVEVGESTVMAAQVGIAGSTKVGANCMMGGQVGIAGHLVVGEGCQIGAQAGVKSDVKQGAKMLGTPAVEKLQFGRQLVNINRIPDLMDRVKELEKLVDRNK